MCERYNIRPDTLVWRLKNGWELGTALTTPIATPAETAKNAREKYKAKRSAEADKSVSALIKDLKPLPKIPFPAETTSATEPATVKPVGLLDTAKIITLIKEKESSLRFAVDLAKLLGVHLEDIVNV